MPNELVRRFDPSEAGVRRSIEDSLERLGLDRIDIAYLHDPDVYDLDRGLAEGLPALARLRDEGVVGAIGIGTNDADAAARAVREGDLDLVMIAGRYTLLEQPALDDLLPLCEARGVGVVAAAPYNSGLLATDEPGAGAHYDYGDVPDDVLRRARELAEACRRHGVSLPVAAIRYPLRHPAVRTVVVGSARATSVRENLERAATNVPEPVWAALPRRGADPVSARVIDAHLHLWDRSRGGYAWITPELGPLDRDFGPDEASAELRAAGVDAAILVQADDSASDTRFMLDVAHRHDWVAGVVGWVPLDDTRAAAAALDELDAEPLLRGIRHLVHDDPRDEFLDLPAVRASLAAVAAHGLAFDVPDAWPRHLAGAGRVARAVPELTVVIDHLAKPPVGTDAFAAWEAELRRVAALPNTMAKFSGLHLPGVPFTVDTVAALLDVALDAFGADAPDVRRRLADVGAARRLPADVARHARLPRPAVAERARRHPRRQRRTRLSRSRRPTVHPEIIDRARFHP